MFRHTFWLALVLCSSLAHAQKDWAYDSLAFYTNNIEKALKKNDYEAVISYYRAIYKEGSKSLSPLIFKCLYDATNDKTIKAHPELLGRIYHHIGNLEFYRSNMAASKSGFQLALKEYQAANMRENAAGMAMNLGVLMERSTAYDSAIMSYEKALPIFKELKDTASVANCMENIGLAYDYKGEFGKALVYINKADSILQTNTPLTSGRWTNNWYNKSTVFTSMGKYDQALEYAFKGLKLSEQLEDERRTNIGYIMLQDVYEKMNDNVNWLKYVRLAGIFAKKTDNGMRLSEINHSLAYHHLDQGKLDSAAYYAQLGFDYYSRNNYVEGMTKGYLLKGKINYQKENYQEAIKNYEKAIDHMPSSGSKALAAAFHRLGSSYMRLKQFDQANDYLHRALNLRKEAGNMAHLSITYQALSECNKMQGNYKNAYDYLLKFKQYEDSVFNETKSEQIAEIQTQYETEKKDQAIAALEQKNEIQRLKSDQQANQIYVSLGGLGFLLILAGVFYNRARIKQKANASLENKNEEIEKRDGEKEMLLKEIHHRVKNNLQVISSLLSMQTRTLNDHKVIDAVKESQSRVKTMALIHEKLYQYDSLSRINMNEYLEQLSDFLTQTYRTGKSIDVLVEAEAVNLDIDTAIPLGLITNELLSNALKYAFQDMEQGQVKITLSKHEPDGYKLIVSDTGKGLNKDLDIDKSTSLGLRLVRTLTRQINGNLSVRTQAGTTFTVEFTDRTVAA